MQLSNLFKNTHTSKALSFFLEYEKNEPTIQLIQYKVKKREKNGNVVHFFQHARSSHFISTITIQTIPVECSSKLKQETMDPIRLHITRISITIKIDLHNLI